MKKYFLLGLLPLIATLFMGAGSIVNTPGVPAGAVMGFAMANCPQGWVVADGTPRSKTVTYKALCDAITTVWGAGDASNCATPDFKTAGRYLRSANATNPVGTLLAQATAKNGLGATTTGSDGTHIHGDTGHAHTTPNYLAPYSSAGTGGAGSSGSTASGTNVGYAVINTTGSGHGHTITVAGDAETRPVSAAVTYCIKY